MIVNWITDPSPVWDKIEQFMMDDNNELEKHGQFIGVFENSKMAGAFLVKKLNEHCYEIHGGVHPDFWGQGPEICDILGKTLFSRTPCLKIIAIIPEYNQLMRKCVEKIGMKQEGIITRSFLKWMKLHDQYLYGICKNEVKNNGG
jgi:RimJ/RimL family protein N-acetyltransferase